MLPVVSSWQTAIEHRPERGTTWLWLRRDVRGEAPQIVKPVEFEAMKRHGAVSKEPTLELDSDEFRDFMQAMVDAAWNMGIRPSGVNDLDNTLEATRYHLEDMRALSGVLRKLKED